MDCALASPPGAAIKVARGRLAQLVERLLYTQDVGGSSPSPPTSLRTRGALAAPPAASRRSVSRLQTTEDDTVLPPSVVNLRRGALHRLFEFLGGAERDLLAGLDLDRFAGGRIAPHAGCTLAHHEDAEAADANAVALLQVFGHQADQVAEDRLSLLFRHLMGFREICGEMLQGHGRLCARFLRCHGWPSSLQNVASQPLITPSH